MNHSSLKDLSQMLSAALNNITFSQEEIGASLKQVSAAMQAFGANEARDNCTEMAEVAADIPMPYYRLDRSLYKTLDVRHEIL